MTLNDEIPDTHTSIKSLYKNYRFDNPFETLHPLVSVIDLTKATQSVNHIQMSYGLYALFLKQTKSCDIKYGRQSYDHREGTVVCFAPSQSVGIDTDVDEVAPPVYGLVFHPDLIRDTSLGRNMKKYTFFSYQPKESLHLSLREKTKAIECINSIGQELEHAIDCHSKTLISRYIELLLDYCSRFYERQFITRNEANKVILQKTERLLDEYISSGRLKRNVYPTNEFCDGILHLSASYYNDFLEFETGKNLYEYFQLKRMEASKKMLSDKSNTVSMVAEQLGFSNVQYFSSLFKRITGVAQN